MLATWILKTVVSTTKTTTPTTEKAMFKSKIVIKIRNRTLLWLKSALCTF